MRGFGWEKARKTARRCRSDASTDNYEKYRGTCGTCGTSYEYREYREYRVIFHRFLYGSDAMSESLILMAALRHAKAGRPVFPCYANKQPATKNGFKDATCDPKQIERWFAYGARLLALPTGKVSGLVVVDIDGEQGWESLRDLERRHEALPTTASVKTPSGGQHYYFKHPGVEVRCSAGQLAPKVDVRGDGGYVVIPPSPGYEPDDQVPPAPLPVWIARSDSTASGIRGTPTRVWLGLVKDGVTQGQRNDSLARFVGHLLRKDVDVDLAAEIAHLVNAHRFKPPLDAAEVDGVVDSIAAAELRRRRK